MDLVGRLIEFRTLSLGDLDALMDRAAGAKLSVTGLDISPSASLQCVAVFACVCVIAETVASLPLLTYRRLASGGKERAPDHPNFMILYSTPNPEMTAFEFRSAMMGHVLLWGNAYAEIQYNDIGPMALWPLRPDKMTLERGADGRIIYQYLLPDGKKKPFAPEQIMHWRGLSSNGVIGYSRIAQAREAVGLALATEQFGARFFGNDSRPGGILVHPGKLTEEKNIAMKARWEASQRGLTNAQRVAVLDEGVKYEAIGIPPEDAQFLETRQFQLNEIARLFRVPPHMIGDLTRATFSNIEHQAIDFVVHTVRPWLVNIEQRIQQDLFPPSDRTYFAEHLVDALLRGDSVARAQALQIQHQNGIINADEWREIENRNAIKDGSGQIYWQPANMMVLGAESTPPESPAQLPAEKAPIEQGAGQRFNPHHAKDGKFAPGGGGGGKSGPIVPMTIDSGPTAFLVKLELADAKLPGSHTDGMNKIGFKEGDYLKYKAADGSIRDAYGQYNIRSHDITLASNAPNGGNIGVFGGNTALHEVGHHVHLAKLTDKAANDWAAISHEGQTARISAYARTNQGEHFSEAYREYAAGGTHRAKLRNLEPESYKFMGRIFRPTTKDMLPDGEMASESESLRRYGRFA